MVQGYTRRESLAVSGTPLPGEGPPLEVDVWKMSILNAVDEALDLTSEKRSKIGSDSVNSQGG
jgi:hypothetical protein